MPILGNPQACFEVTAPHHTLLDQDAPWFACFAAWDKIYPAVSSFS